MSKPAPTKPMITVEDNPFGAFPEEMLNGAAGDIFELPGYSDKRREQELARRAGKRVEPLPRRFQFARATTNAGAADLRKVAARTRLGYRTVKYEEAESLGIRLENEHGDPITAFTKGPDGTVRLNESVLMVCDREHAAANYARQKRDAARQQLESFTSTKVSGQPVESLMPRIETPPAKGA